MGIFCKFSTLIILVLLIACGANPDQKKSSAASMIHAEQEMRQAQQDFGFKLLRNLWADSVEQKNVLMSPWSLYMNLSMLYNGAHGVTKKTMQRALQTDSIRREQGNKVQGKVMEQLMEGDSAVTMDMANALWFREGYKLQKKFAEINKQYYQANLQEADFNNLKTVKAINDWVARQTRGKISSIIEEIKPGDMMYLLNAVYFKGDWSHSFNKKLTREERFYTDSGIVKTPFMYQKERYKYTENDSLQIIALPYGQGEFVMHIFLPADKEGLDNLIHALNQQRFTTLISSLSPEKVSLYLPKWESSYTAEDLSGELSALGMQQALGDNADFSDLFIDKPVQISAVKHKTYIKVDEQGTEAAAVTSTGMTTTALPLHSTPEMRVDHPFLYTITNTDSKVLLFIGYVNNPEENSEL